MRRKTTHGFEQNWRAAALCFFGAEFACRHLAPTFAPISHWHCIAPFALDFSHPHLFVSMNEHWHTIIRHCLIAFIAMHDLGNLYGQGRQFLPPAYTHMYHQGEQALLQGDAKEALKIFRKVLKNYPEFAPAWRALGASHKMLGDFQQAAEAFQSALRANPYHSRVLWFECGEACYQVGRYADALKYFLVFDSLRNVPTQQFTYNGVAEQELETQYTQKLDAYLWSCWVAKDKESFGGIAEVKNLGRAVNTPADEYFPYLSADGRMLLFTSRLNAFSDENIYYSLRNKEGWSERQPLASINTPNNEGMSTLARNGHSLLFTACQRQDAAGICDLWEATLEGVEATNVRPASGSLNTEAWESQASLSCDGRELFFSSTRQGGHGGSDLWVCQRLPGGEWGIPENLGSVVNTAGDEEAPFISADGQTLFFSSTGHAGYGDQDLYFSRRRNDGSWSPPVNLGPPVNSPWCELGFFVSHDGRTGYFASNKPGGEGGMDIYHFELPEVLFFQPLTFVKGQVLDALTGKPLFNTTATIHFDHLPPATTDEAGRFYLCLNAGQTISGIVTANGYHDGRFQLLGPAPATEPPLEVTIGLEPKFNLLLFTEERKVNSQQQTLVQSFLFNFDEAALSPEMKENLNNFIEAILKNHKVANVAVIGYTDDIGDIAYNLKLSEARARNVATYLKNKGLQVQNVQIEGRGEASASSLTTPVWKNRKVEVIVYLEE